MCSRRYSTQMNFFSSLRNLLYLSVFIFGVNAASQFEMSREAHETTTRLFKLHKQQVSVQKGLRKGILPELYLHPRGTKVYGTVIYFHGFTGKPGNNRILTTYMFRKGFNVFVPNAAGHSQVSTFWPSTVLRGSVGYKIARQALSTDKEINSLIKILNSPNLETAYKRLSDANLAGKISLTQKVFAVLRKAFRSEEYREIRRAFSFLRPGASVVRNEKEFRKYFLSDHQRYEAEPFSQLNVIHALPGPVHVIGNSLGGTTAVNLAARSKVISKAVMLAGYFGMPFTIDNVPFTDVLHFQNILGSLNLFTSPSFSYRGAPIPAVLGRIYTALAVAGELVHRESIYRPARTITKTACFIAADDDLFPRSFEYCSRKLGAQTYVYPKRFKIDHFVTPNQGSKYGISLVEEIGNYLINDRVNRTNLFTIKTAAL